jgi:hypothetical protein
MLEKLLEKNEIQQLEIKKLNEKINRSFYGLFKKSFILPSNDIITLTLVLLNE